jgi:2-hydroxyacyl-CoA lyase 1
VDAPSGHDLIARTLRDLGITHVYGVSGTPVYETHAACASIGLRVIGVRHQQAAALMAAAQNYRCGRMVAAVIVSAGPAVTNAATGILVAHDNGWPLIVIGGRRPLHMRHLGSFQELDATAIYRPITKLACLVERAADLQPTLVRAFEVAMNDRPGPVYLDVPEEALQRFAGDVRTVLPQRQAQAIDPVSIERAADILRESRRPAVVIGDPLRWASPFAELAELVARLGAPFVSTPMANGFLPADHPLCHTISRASVLSTADSIVLCGARLDWTLRFGAEFARDAKVIMIGTAQQPSGLNVAPVVSIPGDARLILGALIGRLARREPPAPDLAAWHDQLAARRQATLAKWTEPGRREALPMTPQRLILGIRDALPRDAICVVDGNTIMETAQQLLPSYTPVSRLTPGNNGCMGTGIPFGIGAKLAAPERVVVVICGDFAFGLNAMEMETAARLRVPIIVIIANNDGNGGVLFQQKFYADDYPDRVTALQPGLRYEAISRTLGGHAEYVEHPSELEPAFARAVASQLPACINVRIDPHAPSPK